MRTVSENYENSRLERLRGRLESFASIGRPMYYSIWVDELEVIPCTADLKHFQAYENFIDEATKRLCVIFHGQNPDNTDWIKYVFSFKEESPQQNSSLQGTDEDSKIKQHIASERQRWEGELMKKNYEELQRKLRAAESYISQLTEKLEEIAANKSGILEEIKPLLPLVAEGVKNIAPGLIKVPLKDQLAGEETQKQNSPQEKTSYKKAQAPTPASSDSASERERAEVQKELEKTFSKEEMILLDKILEAFSKKPENIKVIADLLKITTGEKSKKGEEENNGKVQL